VTSLIASETPVTAGIAGEPSWWSATNIPTTHLEGAGVGART
jgi:hypothetical protein